MPKTGGMAGKEFEYRVVAAGLARTCKDCQYTDHSVTAMPCVKCSGLHKSSTEYYYKYQEPTPLRPLGTKWK